MQFVRNFELAPRGPIIKPISFKYKAYAERAVHEYSIPKPNTSSGRQLVLGPVEYLLPYYVDKDRRKSYMVLNMLEEGAVKWSAKRNQQYLACGLQSFLHSQKNNNKYLLL